MSVFTKRAGLFSGGAFLLVSITLALSSQNFQPEQILAGGASSLHKSFNFTDGGSSNNSAYASVNLATNVSYASDNPGGTSGTTAWEADYANLSLTTGTRLGGKLVSTVQTDNTTAWANIKTTFQIALFIDVVTIRDCEYFGTLGNLTNLYLQSSSDNATWSTVKTLAVPAGLTVSNTTVGDGINIVFDGFTIAANSYLRFGIALTASGTNSGFQFNGIALNSYTLCV